ncbi:hypothetical protein AAF712_005366 [Marasmius tenuissimus]|uniref:glucan endo-1,3-beta-D-glucosidase n=1 Tax=Marasmius tenuissimus TaxID=585030 RepID=A0ABR3A2V0_9AGAR
MAGDPESGNTTKSRKWVIIGSVVAVVAIIAIAVGVGVGVTQSNKNKDNNSSSSSSSAGSGATVGAPGSASNPGGPRQTDPNDPSTFETDPNLHKAFWALAYTPEDSQLPNCGNSLEKVIKDVQVCVRYSLPMPSGRDVIRVFAATLATYHTDSVIWCRLQPVGSRGEFASLTLPGFDWPQYFLAQLEAIKQTKTNLQVYLGNYVVPDDNGAAYTRQRDVIKQAIQTYGTDHIAGITVGNEFMLNYMLSNGGGSPDSAIGNTGAAILINNIQDTQKMLSDMKLPKTIPVGNSDAGAWFNTRVLQAVDYGMANVHPWFANVTIQDAASWTNQFFQETNVQPASLLSNKACPKMYIAETGWPTASSDKANESNGAATASLANLQTFMDTFVCQANTNGTGYFFFEFTDEKWKDIQFGGVEGHWGLFNGDRSLKNLKIPSCTAP